jgi:AcrR family transcriptional regulator
MNGGSDTVARPDGRADRSAVTRDRILAAAERLFAEHGVIAVSNRQVAEAAGQGNTAVVGYHFGAKTDLVRAIVQRRAGQLERHRERVLAEVDGSRDLRDWVGCLVRPNTDHLAGLGTPSWWARFGAQIMTDPGMREIMVDESRHSPSMARIREGLNACLPALPPDVRQERSDVGRHLMVHMLAERERALADGTPTPRETWQGMATGLIDVLVAMWRAPVTPVG